MEDKSHADRRQAKDPKPEVECFPLASGYGTRGADPPDPPFACAHRTKGRPGGSSFKGTERVHFRNGSLLRRLRSLS